VYLPDTFDGIYGLMARDSREKVAHAICEHVDRSGHVTVRTHEHGAGAEAHHLILAVPHQ